jgi:hypothetical protein
LILRLPFDETTGTTASDFSLAPARNGSFATLGATGLPTFVSGGKVGGAVNFDGSGQRVEVLDSPEKPLDGMQKLTVSFWFKMTVAEAKARALVVKRTSSNAATTSFSISLTSGQRLSVSVANRTAVSGDNVLVADQWYHVVMVYDGSLATNNLKLYLDGNPEKFGTMTSGEANNAVPRISASRLRVGDYTATSITTTSTGPFNGQDPGSRPGDTIQPGTEDNLGTEHCIRCDRTAGSCFRDGIRRRNATGCSGHLVEGCGSGKCRLQ